jgi:predicted MFS family arabinose efflux permease
VVAVVSQVSFGTYLAVWLEQVAGVPVEALPVVPLLSGVAGAVGVAVVGPHTGQRPLLVFTLASVVIIVGILALAMLGGIVPGWVTLLLVALGNAAFGGFPFSSRRACCSPPGERAAGIDGIGPEPGVEHATTAFNVGSVAARSSAGS